jgi:hypothetical protein
MKIRLSHPGRADELRAALEAADCRAARTADDTVQVEIPWVETDGDVHQARLELTFFVKAWEAQHPGLRAALLEA